MFFQMHRDQHSNSMISPAGTPSTVPHPGVCSGIPSENSPVLNQTIKMQFADTQCHPWISHYLPSSKIPTVLNKLKLKTSGPQQESSHNFSWEQPRATGCLILCTKWPMGRVAALCSQSITHMSGLCSVPADEAPEHQPGDNLEEIFLILHLLSFGSPKQTGSIPCK